MRSAIAKREKKKKKKKWTLFTKAECCFEKKKKFFSVISYGIKNKKQFCGDVWQNSFFFFFFLKYRYQFFRSADNVIQQIKRSRLIVHERYYRYCKRCLVTVATLPNGLQLHPRCVPYGRLLFVRDITITSALLHVPYKSELIVT